MERTIDGIDYIAKSEVLRIIDEEIESAVAAIRGHEMTPRAIFGWECILRSLRVVQSRVAGMKER